MDATAVDLSDVDAVFCDPLKYRPSAFHATKPGDSSKASVIERDAPPSTGTSARREFAWKNLGLPIADEKTIHLPSGEKLGPVSGPGCATSFVTDLSATVRR